MRLAALAATALVVAILCTSAFATGSLVTVNSVQNASLGKILVSAGGHTLYSEGKTAKCTGACAKTWPPLLVGAGAKPVAGPGVRASRLGTLKRPDGKLQVTYRGLALYLYKGDKKAGDVKGQGLGGIWHAISPAGVAIKKSASPATGSTGSMGGTTTTPSGGATTTTPSGTGNTGGGTTTTTPSDCDTNPGGYGCM